MQWFQNMKIARKLILGFVLVALVAGVIGCIGIWELNKLDRSSAAMYENQLVPISDLSRIASDFQMVRVVSRDIILANNPAAIDRFESSINEKRQEVAEISAKYEKSAQSGEMAELFKQFLAARADYGKNLDQLISLARENKDDEAFAFLNGDFKQIAYREMSLIASMDSLQVAQAGQVAESNDALAGGATKMMLIILVLGVLLALGLGYYVSRIIGAPVRALAAAADKLALGDVNVRVEADTQDELGDLSRSFRKLVDNIRENAEAAQEISRGNLNMEIEAKSSADVLAKSLQQVVVILRDLTGEAAMLTRAAVEGHLDTRGNVEKFSGGYREIVKGVNDTLDAVIAPLNVAAEYIDRISKGDIPPKITDTYQGDFNEIKNNVNHCIDGLGGLVEANAVLQRMALNDYSVRVSGSYQGVFAEVGHAVNDVQDRIKRLIATVKRISQGDLGDLEGLKQLGDGKGRRSENDELTPPFIIMMENLQATVADINVLSQSAVDGKLDVRADAAKHEGDYRKIIEGINATLDAVIAPLNVAAEYIDRISKGDIPPKITDAYRGDFNEIKNNVNQCIDGLGGLVEANAVLQRIAVNDLTKSVTGTYQGIFAEVAQATNVVRDRIVHTVEITNRISQGDLRDLEVLKKVGDGRGRRSEEDTLVPAFIRMIGNLQATVADINVLSQSAVDGKLDVRADAAKHEGDYRKIVEGINATLDAVIAPLNVAAEYIDRISKGDIPPKITDTYRGDFNEIKNNVNQCIDGLGGLVEANAVLQRMTLNDLTKSVTGTYQGVFAEVAHATNGVLERVTHTVDIINRIAKGDLSDLEGLKKVGNGKGRRSEEDTLVPAFILMEESLKALVADADFLTAAAIEGSLSTRADVMKHQGDFRKVIEGVNATMDAVVMPIRDALSVIETMSEGDLSRLMTGDYAGDLAKMKNALNHTLNSLNEILGQVNIAADQVVSGSQQVADASQALSQGATEQASSLEEITASMTEMTSQTRQNAENAQQANKLATAARDTATRGNEQMQQMLKAMGEINDSSGQISKIIKVIDEIAFQTNLLALNAAVEAARAGVHGKGFAVVADEVRNLAQRSAKAAKETTELIETSIKTVDNGQGIAIETAKALTEIVSGVTKVTDLVGEIASASNEQAQGINQVNQGLGQVDQVTQSNTASAEESASAAEELSGQASNLKNMLSRFSLAEARMQHYDPRGFEQPANVGHGGNGHGGNGHGGNGKGRMKDAFGSGDGRKGGTRTASVAVVPSEVIALDDEEFGRY